MRVVLSTDFLSRIIIFLFLVADRSKAGPQVEPPREPRVADNEDNPVAIESRIAARFSQPAAQPGQSHGRWKSRDSLGRESAVQRWSAR